MCFSFFACRVQQEDFYDDVEEFNSAPPPLPPSTGSVRATFVANLRYYENDTKDGWTSGLHFPKRTKKKEVEISGELLVSHKEKELFFLKQLKINNDHNQKSKSDQI